MKIIDLLNKIANNEELPEEIKVMGGTYYLCEGDQSGSYYFSEKQGFGGVKLRFDTSVMNEEVEIIEEDKKIEKMIKLNNISNPSDMTALCTMQWENNKIIEKKINEIIDYLNKEE